jgi:hypothetical protein
MEANITPETVEPKKKRRNGETRKIEMQQYDCILTVRKSPPFSKIVEFQRTTTEAGDTEAAALRVLSLYITGWTLTDEAGEVVQFSPKALAECDSDFVTDAYETLDGAGFFPSVKESEEKSS